MSKTITTNQWSLRDVLTLIKPRITITTIIVSAGSMAFSNTSVMPQYVFFSLLGIALLVSGSSAFNMYIERNYDGLMKRTKDRPLPSGRLSPQIALELGWILSLIALPALHIGANNTTVLLGVFALFVYVLVYTPLKRVSSLALFVGAVPGAMPALMGYTAVSGQIDKIGLSLFFLLFLWQLPHFLAISIFRSKEYSKAGYPVIAYELGEIGAKKLIFTTTILLVLSSMSLWIFGAAGFVYKFTCIIFGLWFIFWSLKGFYITKQNAWAKKIFFVSIKYQAFLFLSLVADFYVK